MKVDFRLNNISAVKNRNIIKRNTIQDFNSYSKKINYGVLLSFTANPLKNMAQTASIAPEYQGILNSVYKLGGLGNVAGEASVAFFEKGDMDFRTFIPYYSPENESGGIKVMTPIIENGEQKNWTVPKMNGTIPVIEDGKQVMQEIPAYRFKSVPVNYKLKEGENFVIHEPVIQDKPWLTNYKILKETGVEGSVESVNDTLTGITKTPYKVFEAELNNTSAYKNPPVYIVHTPELAKFPRAYGGSAYAGKSFDDLHYSIFSKATVDAMPKMNTEKFGDFNPGNIWLHDRQAFESIVDMSEKSAKGDEYWTGIKVHSSFHNPGRNYQGHYKNPIDFMRIIGSEDDLKELEKNPKDYAFVKNMVTKIEKERKSGSGKFSPEDILSKEEMAKLNEIFKPLYGEFIDETGEYNLCKIPIASVRKNPYNFTAGTVSTNFGKEMKNHNTSEIAPGLTKDLASIPTVDIVNGSSAKSMGLDKIGDFGKNNGFTSEVKQGYTPLTQKIMSSPDLLFNAKQSNKKWFLDTIGSYTEKTKEPIETLFFSKDAISKGATVLGNLSGYKNDDVLFVSWGRPDTQKGFPTTLEGVLDYFKNDSIKPETKSHAKFLLGAGPWGETDRDWKTIQKQMDEIKTLDNGIYKDNVCYLNGFFTNRIVACADYSNITSRYEPCGITPLESFAGATPVISNKTGGSPDFVIPFKEGENITNQTGFLTKNAYLVNPEVIGADKNLTGVALDEARRIALGKENAKCIEDAMNLFHNSPKEYKKMMTNALASKIDWHENTGFNGGLSAIEKYKECAWSIGADNKVLAGEERNMLPFVNLKGKILQNGGISKNEENLKQQIVNLENRLKEAKENNVAFKGSNGILAGLKNHKKLGIVISLLTLILAGGAILKAKKLWIFKNIKENMKEDIKEGAPKNEQPIQQNTLNQLSFDNFSTLLKKQ